MRPLSLLVCCLLASTLLFAEDDDFDLEFEFGLQKKSTIGNFPLQELEPEVLSDAAIEGALQATSSGSGSGKPAFMEQQEQSEKQSKSELKIESDPTAGNEAFRFGQPTPTFIPYQQPIYEMDTGRINQHNNTAFERP